MHASSSMSAAAGIGGSSRASEPRREPVAWSWLLSTSALVLIALLAVSGRYGYDRDELYFIEAGRHLVFGYPDQPLLTPLLAWTMNTLAPRSLLMLRLPAALAAVVSIVSAGLIARENRREKTRAGGRDLLLRRRADHPCDQPFPDDDDPRPGVHERPLAGCSCGCCEPKTTVCGS